MSKTNTRQIGLPGYELGDYIKESIDFIRRHEPPDGYFVGFSGGKDSIVTLELCRMAGVKHEAYFSCTRIDPPEMYRFIKAHYPDVKWLFPCQSFWSLIVKKGPPNLRRRWCCDMLKKVPSKNIPLKKRIMGIRAEESAKRAKRPRIAPYNGNQTMLKPIFFWPEWAVWEFVEAYNLPYPSIYDEGIGRIGCVVCPMFFGRSENARRKIAFHQARWPGQWKCFKIACRKWYDMFVSKNARKESKFKKFDKFWSDYIWGGWPNIAERQDGSVK